MRWINVKEFISRGGHNDKGWVPLREVHVKDLVETLGSDAGAFNSDGFFVRGDLMLACRSKAKQDFYKARLNEDATRARNKEKTDVDALNERAKRHGGKVGFGVR